MLPRVALRVSMSSIALSCLKKKVLYYVNNHSDSTAKMFTSRCQKKLGCVLLTMFCTI